MKVLTQLKELVSQMESGEYSECDMVTLITRNKESKIPTISSLTEDGVDESHALFGEMAGCLEYAKIQ